jgi:hypothetical protein
MPVNSANAPWPGSFGSLIINDLHTRPSSTVAITYHAPTLAPQVDTTPEALRTALERFGLFLLLTPCENFLKHHSDSVLDETRAALVREEDPRLLVGLVVWSAVVYLGLLLVPEPVTKALAAHSAGEHRFGACRAGTPGKWGPPCR